MKISTVLVGLSLVTSPARAQESQISVQPLFGNGALEGCQLTFDVAFRDFAYDEGRWVHGSGSFVVYSFPEAGVGLMLKLGIEPMDPRNAPVVSPTTAYFINGYSTNANETLSNTEAETPGFKLFMFSGGEQTLAALVGMTYGGLTIGYTRDGGRAAQPFRVPIEDQQLAEWTQCQSALLNFE